MQLRIVTLQNYYNSTHDDEAKHLFHQVAQLRREGYGPDYPSFFLPLDKADFIAQNHLFCVEEGGSLQAIGGFRNVSLGTLDRYRLTLPLLDWTLESEAHDAAAALRRLRLP